MFFLKKSEIWLWFTSCLAFCKLHSKQNNGKKGIITLSTEKNKFQVFHVQKKQRFVRQKSELCACLENRGMKTCALCCMFNS